MVEANENPELVTLKRQHDFDESQRAFSERAAMQADASPHQIQVPALEVRTDDPAAQQTQMLQPSTEPMQNAEQNSDATFRYTRLAIVALLVVILVVAWFRQKKKAT